MDVSDAEASEQDPSELVGLSEEDFNRLMAEKVERRAARYGALPLHDGLCHVDWRSCWNCDAPQTHGY